MSRFPLPSLLRRLWLLLALASACAALQAAPGPAGPSAPTLRLLLGWSPGGSADGVARPLAERLQALLGRPVVVEYKTGASGRLAVQDVVRAAPDGHTLLITPSSPVVLYPHTFRQLGYDPLRDLTPISQVTTFDFALTIGPDVPVAGVQDFLAWLRANPASASVGTAGTGTALHFVGILLGTAGGVDLVHAPYRGGANALPDLYGGRLGLLVDAPLLTLEAHRAGRLRILATTGERRSPFLPEVPTLKESGVDVVADSFIAVYGPPGLDAGLVRTLNRAIVQAVDSTPFKARMLALGMVAAPSTPQELAAITARDIGRWAGPAKASGFVAD